MRDASAESATGPRKTAAVEQPNLTFLHFPVQKRLAIFFYSLLIFNLVDVSVPGVTGHRSWRCVQVFVHICQRATSDTFTDRNEGAQESAGRRVRI